MQGKIWRRVVDRAELPGFQQRHAVISTKLLAGRTVVRVLADAPPTEDFEPSEPSLEDVYFSAMHGRLMSHDSSVSMSDDSTVNR